jgi:hypothetical protein
MAGDAHAALAAAGAFDDASDDDSLERQRAPKRQRTEAAAPAADAPGQFRVLQLPFAGGPKALAVYEDASAGPGGRVWDASVALSRYLAANVDASSEVCARSVVEVGAGAGAPGMTAALMGGVVTLTDRPRVEPLMWRNAALCNQAISWGCGVPGLGGVRVATLEWGGSTKKLCRQCPYPPPVLPCSLVIASDVVGCGDSTLFPALVKTFRDLTKQAPVPAPAAAAAAAGPPEPPRILMSYKRRADFESEFFEQMSVHFDCRQLSVVELEAGIASDFERTDDDSEEEGGGSGGLASLLERLGPEHAAACRAALGEGLEETDTEAAGPETEAAGSGGGSSETRSGGGRQIHIYEFRVKPGD